jgi:hypothetical protein
LTRIKYAGWLPAFSTVSLAAHVFTLFLAAPPQYGRQLNIIGVLFILAASLAAFNLLIAKLKTVIVKRLARENEFPLQKNQLESAIALETEKRAQESRVYKLHHDMNNHLSVIAAKLNDGKNDDAAAYIQALQASFPEVDRP